MAFLPVNIDFEGKKCIVIGGGKIALRKIGSLLRSGAFITVISPDACDEIKNLAKENKLKWLGEPYEYGKLDEAFMVICATDNPAVNAKAAREGKEKGALVLAADNSYPGDAAFLGLVQRGDLFIAVSTNGKSPGLARLLKEEISEMYGEEYGLFLEHIASFRKHLKSIEPESRKRELFWQSVLTGEILTLLREGRSDAAEEKIKNAISSFGSK